MNMIAACVLGMCVIVYLAIRIRVQRTRDQAALAERIKRSFEFAVRREIQPGDSLPPENELQHVS